MNLTEHDLGPVEGFENGKPYPLTVEGKSLVLVRKEEQIFVLRDSCPHAGARLSAGHVVGFASAEQPGEQIDYCRVGEFISCPWHGWEFDLTTGKSSAQPDRVRVATYPVHLRNGRVLLSLKKPGSKN